MVIGEFGWKNSHPMCKAQNQQGLLGIVDILLTKTEGINQPKDSILLFCKTSLF